nr:unnamed protein product [Callosobruchus chinensis]
MLLATLRYLATGDFLLVVADFVGIDKSTACRIVYKVYRAIAGCYSTFIRMPVTDDEAHMNSNRFYNIARFPRCIGAIDCTHIRISSPGIQTRNPVERCFGVWKRCFPILALGIRLKVEKVEAVVIATAVLHNIACILNEEITDVNPEEAAAIQFVNDVDVEPINKISCTNNYHYACPLCHSLLDFAVFRTEDFFDLYIFGVLSVHFL